MFYDLPRRSAFLMRAAPLWLPTISVSHSALCCLQCSTARGAGAARRSDLHQKFANARWCGLPRLRGVRHAYPRPPVPAVTAPKTLPVQIGIVCGTRFFAKALFVTHIHQLSHNSNGQFSWRFRPKFQADRPLDARPLLLGDTAR